MAETYAVDASGEPTHVLRNNQWVPLAPGGVAPPKGGGTTQDRATAATARANADIARQNARQGAQFVDLNRKTGTGGIQGVFADKGPLGAFADTVAGGLFPKTRDNIEDMDRLNSSMLRANIQEGTSSTMNSNVEQMMAKQTYPSVEISGRVNSKIEQDMRLIAALASQKATAMDKYLSRNGTLNGFLDAWLPQEQKILDAWNNRPARGGAPQPPQSQGSSRNIVVDY